MAKETVEDSFVLDVLELAREGNLRDSTSGTTRWTLGGEEILTIDWLVEDDYLRLLYTCPWGNASKTDYSYWMLLERTPARVGGERVWFACPWCEKRVRKLYLPPSGERFLCRGCHRLSYESREKRTPAWAKAWAQLHRLEKDL